MSNPLIVVVHPSVGSVLAVASLCRRFTIPPRVLLVEELDWESVQGSTILLLDYLVALANRQVVPELYALICKLERKGAEVIGHGNRSGDFMRRSGFEALLDRAIQKTPILAGFDQVVANVACCDKKVDAVGLKLLQDANSIDLSGEPCEYQLLDYHSLPLSDGCAASYRQSLEVVISCCNQV